MYMDSKTSFT